MSMLHDILTGDGDDRHFTVWKSRYGVRVRIVYMAHYSIHHWFVKVPDNSLFTQSV